MAKEKMEALVPVQEQPYPVPGNWRWIHLGSVSTNQYGFTAKAIVDNRYPKMLRITDIQESGVNWDTVPNCVIDDEECKKYKLDEKDIVVARIGATTGKSYLLNDPPLSVFASYLIRIRTDEVVLPDFVYMFLQTELYWQQIMELSSGIAQPGVNSSKLQTMLFPLAPQGEQQRIVDRITSMFYKLDEAQEKIQAVVGNTDDRSLAMINNMRKSILAKAFRGELGTNDPSEPPVELS